MPGRQAWGDDDDDDEYLPPRQESAVDSKGVKSIVEYHLNDNGAKVREESRKMVGLERSRRDRSVDAPPGVGALLVCCRENQL